MAKAGNSVGRSGGRPPSERGQESDSSAKGWRVDASLPVGSFMRTDVAYLRENMWVDAALSFLSERGLRDAPVLDEEGRPVGVLYVDDVETEDSFADGDRAAEQGEAAVAGELERGYGMHRGFHLDGRRRLRVREVMVPYVPEISAQASIASAGVVMHDHQLDHVMVVGDDGRAVGTFSRDELVEWLVDQTSGELALESGRVRCLRDIMRPLISVRRRASLLTARDLLATHDLEELPVVEGGRVVGLVSEGDIYGIVSSHRDDDGWMQELLVDDIMKPAPLVRGPDEALDAVLSLLQASSPGHTSCVLVEQDGRVIGMVSARDLDAGAGGLPPQGPRPHLQY
jgi:CBS domain-containing protein